MINYTEKKLEDFIVDYLVSCNDYFKRDNSNYDKKLCLDSEILLDFLDETQKENIEKLKKRVGSEYKLEILNHIKNIKQENEILKALKSFIEIKGIRFYLAYSNPNNDANPSSLENYEKNKLSIIRQLYYSQSNQNSLDMVIFLNGLPLITIELKNTLTGQNVNDAINQYKNTRDSTEPLFSRCIVHFALDNDLAYISTKLEGSASRFLPFNRGLNDGSGDIGLKCGAGNPPKSGKMKTAYIWEKILTKESIISLIFDFTFDFTQDNKKRVLFPRYHQFDVVKKLLKDCMLKGVGEKYLIQHSAGSGKSHSIAWLALQLVSLHRKVNGKLELMFDSIIVVTDRKALDRQIQENIKSFSDIKELIAPITEGSSQLKDALKYGKKIIITTIQKFPYIADDIDQMNNKKFAVIIDEAHSSQSGISAQKLGEVIGGENKAILDEEDRILEIIKNKKLASNASYFAFTATPKPKTLEIFGKSCKIDGIEKFTPFHLYSMKQAIEEGFILDVLKGYTTYKSYFKITSTTQENPLFDKTKAIRKIRCYVEKHPDTIAKKTKIMVEHFHFNISNKIGGKAKAMIVTSSRESAIKYFFAFKEYLKEYPQYKALVAFSGDILFEGESYSERVLNGFSEEKLKDEFKKDSYRFLIVAEKYQTGFDEPLLHTMYVDKNLSGVNAVQTLSRLNRICNNKVDTCVIDFVNTHEDIKIAFEPFYTQTYLDEPTDIDKIFNLKSNIESYCIYTQKEIDEFVNAILNQEKENIIHSKLDVMVERYLQKKEEEKLDFYQKAKNYSRDYSFLSLILPFEDLELEKLFILLNKLLYKLNLPKGEDLSRGIINNIDLASHIMQFGKKEDIILKGSETMKPSKADGTNKIPETTLAKLIEIIREYNKKHGEENNDLEDNLEEKLINIKDKVLSDEKFIEVSRNSDEQNIKIEFDEVLSRIIFSFFQTDPNLCKHFSDNNEFKDLSSQTIFNMIKSKLDNNLIYKNA